MTDGTEAERLAERLRRAVTKGEDGCGTLPAKEAVKVRPADWHSITRLAREAAREIEILRARMPRLSELEAGHAGGGVVDIEDVRSQAEMLLLAIMSGDPDSELKVRVNDIIAALAPSPSAGERPHSYSPDYQAMGDCRVCGNQPENCTGRQPTPPATPVQPTASVEAVARAVKEEREACARIVRGWMPEAGPDGLATIQMSTIDAMEQIEKLIRARASLSRAAPPQEDGGQIRAYEDTQSVFAVMAEHFGLNEPTPSPAPVSAPATDGEVVELMGRLRRMAAHYRIQLPVISAALDEAVSALSNPAPGHGEAVPVAWQCRYRKRGTERWSDWGLGNSTLESYHDFEREERPLYAHPVTGEKPAPATQKPEDQSHG